MISMILPTDTVLQTASETSVHESRKLIFKGLENVGGDGPSCPISVSTRTEKTFDMDESSCDLSPETHGPLLTPAPRPILKSNSNEQQSKSNSSNSKVGFDSVRIRSYQQTMGDNPAVAYGPPIQLDWEYEEHDDIDIDEFESQRVFARKTTLRQLTMSYYQRKAVLSRAYGFNEEELRKAKKDANAIKFQRCVTNTLLPMMHVEAVLESARRKAKRIVSRKGKQ